MDVTSEYNESLALDTPTIIPLVSSRPRVPDTSVSQEASQPHPRSRKPRRERKAACTECRQQKLKCDFHIDPNRPCSRCKKLDLSCFQALGFQRVEVRKARKSKSNHDDNNNIQQETRQFPTNTDSVATSMTSRELNQDHANLRKPLTYTDDTGNASPNIFQPRGTVSNLEQSDHTIPLLAPTLSRYLSDIFVSDKIIDECFNIFFSHYSPLLPIFTARLIPNDCYHKSLTLFWAIIAIGSRSLVSDPTLLHVLAPEVLNLALTSFQLRRNQLDDIKGLLLLCTWPCPSTTLLKDTTVALSGLLLSLSMQAGLHVPTSAFAHLTGLGTEKQSHRQVELASLWAHVVIACQSTMTFGGYPSIVSFTNMASSSFEKTSWQFLPNNLKLRYEAHSLLSGFESVIVDLGLDSGPKPEQSSLSTRIKAAETQLDQLHVEFCSTTSTPYDEIYVQIARLLLEVLQLYCNADANDQPEFSQLFCTASAVIMAVKTLDDTTNIASYAPSFLTTSISLAAFALLRMAKSQFEQLLGPDVKEEGKSAFFIAVNLLKRMSLMNNDICAKSAEFLSTMWTNQSFFKTSGLSGWCKLRIRNRLSMGVVFDSIFVWIETYGCINVVPARLLIPSDGPESFGGLSGTPHSINGGPNSDHPSSYINERWLYELDWSMSLDSLMAEQTWGTSLP